MIHETIAAVSTPLGEGGIGMVRLSGESAVQVVDHVFRSPKEISLAHVDSHTIHYGMIRSGERTLDEVLVSVMRAPRTYTREDVVEINCHGGMVATRSVLDAVLNAGARMAERGEFTKRAFLNGRISLDQAKAVLDVVQARTSLGLEAAIDRLGGRFTHELMALRSEIAAILSDLEVEIDYPDLDVHIEAIGPRIDEVADRVRELLSKAESGRLLREGLTIAIVGRPNVGKSTLLNALLAEERAIVTPIPGTTRDTIEEAASLDGIPVRWIDTAGLRDAEGPVEEEGVRRTHIAINRADYLLLLLDGSEALTPDDVAILGLNPDLPSLVVVTKSDLSSRWQQLPYPVEHAMLRISAKTGQGMTALREAITNQLVRGEIPTRNSVLLLDTWERDLLRRTGEQLEVACNVARENGQPDMVAEELRLAFRTASELQGIDVSESILDAIFARFCVGK